MNSKRRTKSLLTNLALLAGSLTVSFLLLEQGYRVFLFGWDSWSISQVNSLHGIGVSGMLRASEHKELVYELQPNLDTHFKLTPFVTNSQGLRDQEYSLSKPPNTYRIAMVGDSFTLPSGVAIEEAFHTRLEDRLNRESAGQRFEILNFGVGGYSLRQYVGVIEEKCSLYEPDLILIGYCARNDHKHPVWQYKRKWVKKPVEAAFFDSFAWLGLQQARVTKGHRHPPDLAITRKLGRKHKKYLNEYLDKLVRYSEAQAIPIAVVLLDVYWYEVPFLERRLQEIGFGYLNASLSFRGRDARDYILFPLDTHPNSAANAIFAEEIYTFLIERFEIGLDGGQATSP